MNRHKKKNITDTLLDLGVEMNDAGVVINLIDAFISKRNREGLVKQVIWKLEPPIEVDLVAVTCPECHMTFGISTALHDHLDWTGKYFFCPNKHAMELPNRLIFDTEITRLQKRIDTLSKRPNIDASESINNFCDAFYHRYFKKEGIKTIGQVIKMGRTELIRTFGIGEKCANQIDENLNKKFGIRLGDQTNTTEQ